MTVDHVLSGIARRDPTRTAVIVEDRRVDFAGLIRDVLRLARWFERQGIAPGDTLGLSVAGEYEHLAACLALMRLGCRQVALPTFDPEAMRAPLAGQCGVSAVIAEAPRFALPDYPVLVPDFDEIFAWEPAGRATLPAPDPDGIALLLHSSGTTGHPKIIPVTQRQLLIMAPRYWTISRATTSFFAAPIEFGPARRQCLGALCLGKTAVLMQKGALARPDRLCRDLSVGLLCLSNMQAKSLIDAADGDPTPLLPPETILRIGGSAVETGLRQAIRRIVTPELYVAYGTTEAFRISVAGPALEAAGHTGVGRPLPDVDLQILDADGMPLPPGRTGEIRVRTPGMATGYYGDPELSARAFRDGWYYTGDVGVLDGDGLLYLEGRRDEMMSMNGVNVFPREIEDVIEGFPGVVECAAFSTRSPVHGDIPVAAVKVAPGTDLTALHRYCRERLGIRAPRKFFPVEALPRNAAGKVVRGDVARMFAHRPRQDTGTTQPQKERSSS